MNRIFQITVLCFAIALIIQTVESGNHGGGGAGPGGNQHLF